MSWQPFLSFPRRNSAASGGPAFSGSFSSANLQRTPSAGTTTKWTVSFWMKTTASGSFVGILGANSGRTTIGLLSGKLECKHYNGGVYFWQLTTTATYNDNNWYHVVVAVDTSLGTASDRVKIYVNGTRVTSFTTSTNPSSGQASFWNDAVQHNIGSWGSGNIFGAADFSGLLYDIHGIENLELTPSSFASGGLPIAYTGSYGTRGFRVDFAASGDLGNDVSGNNNDWTNTSVTQSSTIPP